MRRKRRRRQTRRERPRPAAVTAAAARVVEAIELFEKQPFGHPRGPIIAAEMTAVLALAQIGLSRLHGAEPSSGEVESAAAMQREAWLMSSRPGGLEDSLAKLRR